MKWILVAVFLTFGAFQAGPTLAEEAKAGPSEILSDDYVLVTIFLKHDQSKNLKEIQSELAATGFWANFPPVGVEVESWYVMMGIGQVVTLRVPPRLVRVLNRTIESDAWGPFRTEIYLTYDIEDAAKGFRAKARSRTHKQE